MNKMAMFFEGRTELEFNCKLIEEIASHRAVTIESQTLKGVTTKDRSSRLIRTVLTDKSGIPSTHFFLLFNCVGESAVKSRMLAEYPTLAKAGYSEIVCQRDVAPDVAYADIKLLELGLPKFVPTKPINVTFVLSVMEVEAWFLAEHTHFSKIDPRLTIPAIVAAHGFNPIADDIQKRPSPANDLRECYGLVGKQYTKQLSQTTIDAIDFVTIYLETVERFPHLKTLCDILTRFLGV